MEIMLSIKILICTISLFVSQSPDPRALEVRQSFLHAWKGYKEFAFGSDELRPLTNKTTNDRFQHWGATMVDALSTLWLMDLKDEFYLVVEKLYDVDFSSSPNGQVLFFETVIRYLGGLVSAYDLSGEVVLLQKAIQLADKLMLAFESPSGFPYYSIDFNTDIPDKRRGLVLAEIGTVQLEFTRLSQITGDNKYSEAALGVFDKLNGLDKPITGLYPLNVDANSGEFMASDISFGALGDSFYEYLVKVYMLTKDKKYLNMFDESMRGLKSLLARTSSGSLYLPQLDRTLKPVKRMDHLSFFVPAMLTLASKYLGDKMYMDISKDLTETIYQIYTSTPTNLGPEVTEFSNEGFKITSPQNYLRPEMLESLYYLYKHTKDPKYQDYVHKIYTGFENYSKTPSAYACYSDVRSTDKKNNQRDVMESFFFAETFKYLYLSFMPPNYIDFNYWVLTTEGHPIRITTSNI